MSNAGFATASHDGFEITSTHADEATLRQALGAPEPPPADPPADPPPAAEKVEDKPPAAAKAEPADDEDLQPVEGEPDPASEAGKTLAKRRRSMQSRLDQERAKRGDAERKAAELERQLAEARRAPAPDPAVEKGLEVRDRLTSGAPPAEDEIQYPAELADLPKPKLAEFQNRDDVDDPYAAWMDAVADWSLEQATRRIKRDQFAERVRIERDSASRAERDRVAQYTQRLEVVRTKHADFDAVAAAAADLPLSGPMRDYFINDERGPEVYYHLCQHPEECTRIAALPPALAFKELGKLEARIDQETQQAAAPSGPAPVVEEKTKAKPPIKPVVSSPVAVQDGPPPDDAPFDVHQAYWNRYDREHGRRV